jgi:hypothetical protein
MSLPDEEFDVLGEDELALLTQRFERMHENRVNSRRNSRTYFKCGKTEHFFAECLKVNNHDKHKSKDKGRRSKKKEHEHGRKTRTQAKIKRSSDIDYGFEDVSSSLSEDEEENNKRKDKKKEKKEEEEEEAFVIPQARLREATTRRMVFAAWHTAPTAREARRTPRT